MKKTIQVLLTGTKEIVWYLFQVAVLSGAVILGFKWSGDLLEPICEHVNVGVGLFLIFAVISGEFHAGNDGYAMTLANNFSSYGAGLTVVVCNGNGVHSAAVCKKDEIFNAERSIRETGVAM